MTAVAANVLDRGFEAAAPNRKWIAANDSWPLLSFAGLGQTDPNAEVRKFRPEAMPVILTMPEEHDVWMCAPWDEARRYNGRCRMER